MKSKTDNYKLRITVTVFLLMALILPSFSVSAFAAEDPLPEARAEETLGRIRASGFGAWQIGAIARRATEGEQVVVDF